MQAPALISEGTTIEDFADITKWSKDAGVGTLVAHRRCLDDVDKSGTTAYINITASPAACKIWRTDKSMNMSAMESVTLDFGYYHNIDINSYGVKIKLEFSSTTNFAKSFISNEVTAAQNYVIGGLRLTFHKDDFTASGGELWSNTMVAIRFHMTPYGLSYGWAHQARFYLDKIVVNRQWIPMVTIGATISPSPSSRALWLGYMAEYGWYNGKINMGCDYDNIGDSTYCTWAQMAEADNSGIWIYPHHTAWMMQGGDDVDQLVPPYPAYDATYSDWSDGTSGQYISEWHHWEIMRRERAIHDYYDIPWRTAKVGSHGGNMYSVDCRRWLDASEFSSYVDGSGWTSVQKGIQYMSNPIGRQLWNWPVYIPDVSHANVMTAIDECVATGRYLNFLFFPIGSGTSYWLQSDLETELDHIKEHESLGDLIVVSPDELITMTRDSDAPAFKSHEGSSEAIYLGTLGINDGVNYFIDSEGVNLGERQARWDDAPSYSGVADAQVNVQRSALIPVTIPMRVHGNSSTERDTKLAALWVEVDKSSNVLDWQGSTYTIANSTRPDTIERDQHFQLGFDARFTLVLMRKP